ncbi:hypothetical protein HW49_03820 [Porphyromonadaceae bacterium COT-184 OH4590]|nr:hypothetical protein HW49_03820 [Porphyromonadaceae bacterium COT-184 OH4590]
MGCSSSSQREEGLSEKSLITIRESYTVDLFSEGEVKTTPLKSIYTYKEAYSKSELVIFTSQVQKIDSSFERGGNKFYLYQISEGYIAKSLRKIKPRSNILFLSNHSLFNGKSIIDSVSLFLTPLEGYKLLKNNINIHYQWLSGAPFLPKNREH